jgi:hypothetical protein
MKGSDILFLLGFGALIGAFAGIILGKGVTLPDECPARLARWDALQVTLADCREDPDCYITPADLERVRTLAPAVVECEDRIYGREER